MAEHKDKRGDSSNRPTIHLTHIRAIRLCQKHMSLSHTQAQDKVELNKPVNRTIRNLNILIHSTLDLKGQDHTLTMEVRYNHRTLLTIHSSPRTYYLKGR